MGIVTEDLFLYSSTDIEVCSFGFMLTELSWPYTILLFNLR